MDNYLETWEWGEVRIVDEDEIYYADYIRDDVLGEWSYYITLDDEVVAVHNWDDEEE